MKIVLCRYCGSKFKHRKGKLYCNDKCRYSAWSETAEPCYYCGSPADTIDHIPPKSVRQFLIDHQVSKWEFKEVSACHECNTSLGTRLPWTPSGRKEAIKEILRKKYKHELAMPAWGQKEIDDLGHGLKEFVNQSRLFGEWIRKRIQW